jgi:hypothetical protein
MAVNYKIMNVFVISMSKYDGKNQYNSWVSVDKYKKWFKYRIGYRLMNIVHIITITLDTLFQWFQN